MDKGLAKDLPILGGGGVGEKYIKCRNNFTTFIDFID